MPTPYSGSCGAKMRSMPAPTACWSADRPGASSAITGAPAESVGFAQARRALDDPGEADPLAGRGEPGKAGEQDGPPGGTGACGESHAEQRAERVGTRVAEHDLLAQVGGQQRGGRPDR